MQKLIQAFIWKLPKASHKHTKCWNELSMMHCPLPQLHKVAGIFCDVRYSTYHCARLWLSITDGIQFMIILIACCKLCTAHVFIHWSLYEILSAHLDYLAGEEETSSTNFKTHFLDLPESHFEKFLKAAKSLCRHINTLHSMNQTIKSWAI